MVFIVQIICSVREGLRPAGAVIHRQRGFIRRAVIRREGLFDVCTAVLHTRRRLEQQPLGLRIIAGLPALDRVGDIKSVTSYSSRSARTMGVRPNRANSCAVGCDAPLLYETVFEDNKSV